MLTYDAHTLWEYISQTGDLRDPITRELFAKHELMRLQRRVGTRLPLPPLASRGDVTRLLRYWTRMSMDGARRGEGGIYGNVVIVYTSSLAREITTSSSPLSS